MKKLLFFFLWVLILGFEIRGQVNKNSIKICIAGHPRELQEGFDTVLAANNYTWVPIIYENDISPEANGILNVDLFTSRIRSLFPDSLQSGICVLNWEAPVIERLINNDRKSKVYVDQCNEMIKALKIAKQLRPKIKWGYYGLNIQAYYTRSSEWKYNSRAFDPVLKQADILFPSMYKFYPYSYTSRDFEYNYAYENILINLQIGQEFSKPVYPFIWPRFHDADTTVGLKSIPDNEWSDHIEFLSKAKFKNKKIDGLVMWTMDVYFIRVSPTIKSEIKNEKEETYRQRNLLHYLEIARQASLKQ